MGWLKGLVGIAALTGSFYVGYWHGRAEADRFPYSLEQEGADCTLTDKKTGIKEPITADFQLGDLDYRVNGIFKQMKTNPAEAEKTIISSFHRHYQPR